MKFFKKCPLTPYDPATSDGCSFFPDGNYRGCCLDHDMAYYYGGNKKAKRRADLELAQCVEDAGHPYLAQIILLGVTVFGGPLWPHRFRWGKGLEYCKSFSYGKQVDATNIW